MYPTLVTNAEELQEIVTLSQKNLRTQVSDDEKQSQGFITFNYDLQLLQQMHMLFPSVIVKDENKVVAYAMVALKATRHFHHELSSMIGHLETLSFHNKKLAEYNYYLMGQICIDKAYRGKGIFQMLYDKHKSLFKQEYDFVVTEISTGNPRSQRAHEKVGFKTIHTYTDELDEWNVVLWNWQ